MPITLNPQMIVLAKIDHEYTNPLYLSSFKTVEETVAAGNFAIISTM